MEYEDLSWTAMGWGKGVFPSEELIHDLVLGVNIHGFFDVTTFIFIWKTTVYDLDVQMRETYLQYRVHGSGRDSSKVCVFTLESWKTVLLGEVPNEVGPLSSIQSLFDNQIRVRVMLPPCKLGFGFREVFSLSKRFTVDKTSPLGDR